MVEIFKTNIQRKAQSKKLLSILSETFPSFKINFDLADCDKILRVEGEDIELAEVITFVKNQGFECEVLE